VVRAAGRWLAAAVLLAGVAGCGSAAGGTGHGHDLGGRPSSGRAASARPAKDADAVNGDCAHPEASLPPSSASGPAVERIRKRGKLIVGVDQNSYLWGFRNAANGEIMGFDIDLVKAIAKEILGSSDDVTLKTVPTDKRVEAIEKGEVDMVVRTMSITCGREKQVAFSSAYFKAGQQLLVAAGDHRITGFDDSLRGRKVCTAKGSTGQAKLQQQPHGAKVVLVTNQLDCLVRLQLGQVDAVFTDNALAAGQLAQDPYGVRLVGRPVTTEFYGVAMNRSDTDLVRRVNLVLQHYRAGGDGSAWMRAYRKWLQPYLGTTTGPPAPLYTNE
jgi:polar amino acid transport system substrate-binding protein